MRTDSLIGHTSTVEANLSAPLPLEAYRQGLQVDAPGRLHMGFLDMDGSLGRRFGSVGVGLDEIETSLTFRPASELTVEGPDSDRALATARQLETIFGRSLPAHITVRHCVPPHSGLGSGTQMALATGRGLALLHGLPLTTSDIAVHCGRGKRSGIGIAAFDDGGLIVDAGRNELTRIPPVISRLPFPPLWRFLLILDPTHVGIHGEHELNAFKTLPPFPKDQASKLCHNLMMLGLSALVEADIQTFGAVIHDLQSTVGDHFALAQGGRFTSPKVSGALAFLQDAGAVGIGQSSWGPTGFAMVDHPQRAEMLCQSMENEGFIDSGLIVRVVTPRREGARISPCPMV